MPGYTLHMTKSLSALKRLLNENGPVIMVGDKVNAKVHHYFNLILISSASAGSLRMQLAQMYRPSAMFIGCTNTITFSLWASRKCSIHLDLSIVTILITPECRQPAKLGGEYWFSPANWLIAAFRGALFPLRPPVSYFAMPYICQWKCVYVVFTCRRSRCHKDLPYLLK